MWLLLLLLRWVFINIINQPANKLYQQTFSAYFTVHSNRGDIPASFKHDCRAFNQLLKYLLLHCLTLDLQLTGDHYCG